MTGLGICNDDNGEKALKAAGTCLEGVVANVDGVKDCIEDMFNGSVLAVFDAVTACMEGAGGCIWENDGEEKVG